MTVDLPRWTLADRLTCALAVAAGIALEVVAAGQEAVPGLGLLSGAALLLWHGRNQRRRPGALVVLPAGHEVVSGAPGCEPCIALAGSRILGPSIVLHWRPAAGRRQAAWLTPLDLPRPTLRRLAVRLATGHSVVP